MKNTRATAASMARTLLATTTGAAPGDAEILAAAVRCAALGALGTAAAAASGGEGDGGEETAEGFTLGVSASGKDLGALLAAAIEQDAAAASAQVEALRENAADTPEGRTAEAVCAHVMLAVADAWPAVLEALAADATSLVCLAELFSVGGGAEAGQVAFANALDSLVGDGTGADAATALQVAAAAAQGLAGKASAQLLGVAVRVVERSRAAGPVRTPALSVSLAYSS